MVKADIALQHRGRRQQHLVLLEFERIDRPAGAGQIGRRGAQDHLAARELAGDEIALGRIAQRQDGDVMLLVDAGEIDRRGQRQRDARMLGMEGRQMARELMAGEGRGHHHPQMAVRLLAGGLHQRLGLVHVGEDGAHPLQIAFAHAGQGQAAGGALDESGAEMVLQLGHQPGDDRWRQVERPCGTGKAALVDDAGEDAHRAQLIHECTP